MDRNLIWQYTIVLLLILLAIAWIVRNMIRKRRNGAAGGCAGCSLADTCRDKKRIANTNKCTLGSNPNQHNSPVTRTDRVD